MVDVCHRVVIIINGKCVVHKRWSKDFRPKRVRLTVGSENVGASSQKKGKLNQQVMHNDAHLCPITASFLTYVSLLLTQTPATSERESDTA